MKTRVVDQDVMLVLEGATVSGNILVLAPGIERKLYLRVNATLEALGAKWNRARQGHVFPCGAKETVEQVLLTGEVALPKDLGYFPTPPPVVTAVLDRLDLPGLEHGMSVLEPSAGDGAIARVLAARGVVVDCVEIDPRHEASLRSIRAGQVTIGNFLDQPASPVYHRVAMNPPFERQLDIRHVTQALLWVAPGGRLVSVMSGSVEWRENAAARDFRALVDLHGGSIERLPEGSFKPSGTDVRAALVTIPVRAG